MATSISNGESGLSVRTKLNDIWHSLDLNEYNKEILDTAVDVFVYDTSKDSDGGRWRHRCQGTSWYNETLNTATRGSRKEFPAVAVIVAESTQVTIYDGDDPDLPMWMVFNAAVSQSYPMIGRNTVKCISVVNGNLFVGTNDALAEVNFLKDNGRTYRDDASATYLNGPFNGNIEQRNDLLDHTLLGSPILVNDTINDVAMTVLPNAPIDAATGLPVPTIAVATAGGVSVIKDDGTVVDITESSGPDSTHAIEFTDDNKIVFMWSDTSGIDNYPHIGVMPIPSSDVSQAYYYSSSFIGEDYSFSSTFTNANDGPVVVPNANAIRDFKALSPNKSVGYDSGLSHIYSNPSDARKSMVAYTTSTYNTGWMNGDIKLATLSDTDDTDVTGTDYFSSIADGDWTLGTGVTVSSGDLTLSNATGSQDSFFSIASPVGSTLVVEFTVANSVAGAVGLYLTGDSGGGVQAYRGANGTYSETFSITSATQTVRFRTNGTTTLDVTNVSVRLAEEDRSVNGNGLQVFGSITKNPVATGADLVAYSGFNVSDYLEQPYNSDLDFGTGDFCVMGWVELNAAVSDVIVCKTSSGSDRFRVNTALGKIRLLAGSVTTGSTVLPENTFTHFVVTRKSGVVSIYVNGDLDGSGSDAGDVSSVNPLLVGISETFGSYLAGSLALLRISATAPTAEQIAKIYEDEKVLFQENAQATLYGSSDAVTALAYDDTTELLHVGTSAGRSVFQGLRRVDNTTDAVGAAISASNGLVAEE